MTEARPLHVLMLLNSCYPPPQGGGTQMQVRVLAKALRMRGHKVTVVAPLTDARTQRRVERIDGVPVCRLAFPRMKLVGTAWVLFRLSLFLLRRRNRYDAWHVHSPRLFGAVAALLGSALRKPAVVVKVASALELELGTLSVNPSLWSRAQYLCLRRADAWQAISHRIAEGIAATGIPAQRIAAIPNAVDTDRFCPTPRVPAAGRPRFVFVGRLVEVKNLPMLLQGFATLLQFHPRSHLRIVGTGPLEDALKQQCLTLGISEQVEFAGHCRQVERLIADADFGVLPSSTEGLSNTLLECMACGLPMIASRVSGSEDLVRPGGNGWLFEPGDMGGLVRCLVEAASLSPQQRLQLGCESRATIERHASLDSVVERLVALYRGSAPPLRQTTTVVSEAR